MSTIIHFSWNDWQFHWLTVRFGTKKWPKRDSGAIYNVVCSFKNKNLPCILVVFMRKLIKISR